ncbi:hypothetical protein MD484_g5195, partial [Candolleomyces efflorescens]
MVIILPDNTERNEWLRVYALPPPPIISPRLSSDTPTPFVSHSRVTMYKRKRRTISGLTGLELQVALTAIDQLIGSSREEDTDTFEPGEVDLLNQIRQLLSSKTDALNYTFSRPTTTQHLLKLSIVGKASDDTYSLKLKPGSVERAQGLNKLGNGLWSASYLFQHLTMLEKHVPRSNEAATRLWIEAFFFRILSVCTATIPRLVLSLEQPIPPDTFSGNIDCTLMCSPDIGSLLRDPVVEPGHTALLVAEAKLAPTKTLPSHIPQTIAEMAACAKTLKAKVIRGVLTNGQEWLFLVLVLNAPDAGGTWWGSHPISIMFADEESLSAPKLSERRCSLICAILMEWQIQNCFKDLGVDEFFVKE